MNSREIACLRLYNQRLWGTPFETPEDVVHSLAAMQSQEFAYAKWSVAQRANGVSDSRMDQAFANGSILRTHVLRPTWHFVLPADIRWILDLTAPRVNALNAYYYGKFGLDGAVFAKSNALFTKALKGGRHLTRRELAGILQRAGIAASGLALAYILMRAELDAVVCSGTPSGKQQTYALFDQRVRKGKTLTRDEALAELTRRYFTSRGPATLKDYLQWCSLTASDGKRGLEIVKSKLEHVVVDGRTYWFTASSPSRKAAAPVINLVQGYDEYIMSYSESKDVLRLPGTIQGEAVFTHAILLDGRVIGHWRRVVKKKTVAVETYLHRPLGGAETLALEAAVERYGRFMELPATCRLENTRRPEVNIR